MNPMLHGIVQSFITSREFCEAPASEKMHHAYAGGLLQHTVEVVELCKSIAGNRFLVVDHEALLAAAWLHDVGKIYDYELRDGIYVKTKHLEETGHLCRSYALFYAAAVQCNLEQQLRDKIGHCILSHHGRVEWGAAKEPRSTEAWILHFADMLSSRCIGQSSRGPRYYKESLWAVHDSTPSATLHIRGV